MRVVVADIIEIPASLYRLVRSFVDSSEKDKYIWNIGVAIGDYVIFTKPGKWVLRVIKSQTMAELKSLNSPAEVEYSDQYLKLSSLSLV
jgi:hypothetical protein